MGGVYRVPAVGLGFSRNRADAPQALTQNTKIPLKRQ